MNSKNLENNIYTIKELYHIELLQKTSCLKGNIFHLSIQFYKTVKINGKSNILEHLQCVVIIIIIIIAICKEL